MKKIICLFLILSVSLSLFSCGANKYEPKESTEEESRVIMTMSYGEESYDIKYELYRAIFLNYIGEYDYKKDGFFDTAEGKAAVKSINDSFISLCADIYSSLYLAKKIGYDPFSSDADRDVAKIIADDVDNEYFNGDYELYLKTLSEMNMNYSVQDLLIRYQLAYDKVIEHYKGTVDTDAPSTDMTEGSMKYEEKDVRDYYFSDDCVRVSIIKISYDIPRDEAERVRDKIAEKPTESEALAYASTCTLSDPYDVFMGAVIGRYTSDYVFYEDVMTEAFTLGMNETGKLHLISSSLDPIYWVLYRTAKTDEHFEECYEDIADSYLSDRIGKIISDVTDKLEESAKTNDVFAGIKHSEIKMQ